MPTILEAINTNAMIDLAMQMVRIPSFKTEEAAMAHFLVQYFGERGYRVELQEVEPGRFQTIAILSGSGGGKSLMFNGHIDIDPLAYGWKRNPWEPEIDGDRLYGGGIRNMKAGVASMIEAAEAVRRSGIRLKGDIVVACVVGELQGGVGTVYLCEHGPLADMAIVTEPHGANNIITVHAGVMTLAVHVIGRSAHTARKAGSIDAIEKMCKIIPLIKSMQFTCTPRSDLPALPLVNTGVIMGGMGRNYDLKGSNFVSDFCTVLVDVRFLPGMTCESVLQDFDHVLQRAQAEDSDLSYELELPPPKVFKAAHVVMEPFDLPRYAYIIDSVSRQFRIVHGKEPDSVGVVLPNSYSGNDTSHLWKAGIPCVLHGPAGGQQSSQISDEYSSISQMEQVARVLALTAADVCNLPA